MKQVANFEAKCAISMCQYGISTIVKAPVASVEYIFHELEVSEDEFGVEIESMKCMHSELKAQLLVEDAYFSKHLHNAYLNNQRWDEFLNDCVFFAALDTYVYGTPLELVHLN